MFYSSREWQNTRDKVMNDFNGLDIYSLYMLKTVEPGEIVHHIIPIKEDWDKRLDLNNLIPLTERNHKAIHSEMNKDKKRTTKILLELIKRFEKEYKRT